METLTIIVSISFWGLIISCLFYLFIKIKETGETEIVWPTDTEEEKYHNTFLKGIR